MALYSENQMLKAVFYTVVVSLAAAAAPTIAADGIVVIGHPNLHQLDTVTIAKIFMGKVIEVDGIAIIAVNASSGSPVRNRFLQTYLNQDEGKYTAYWTVRRYIGKGSSPRELPRSVDIINFVNSTPGAIGYINEGDMQPGVNVLLK